MAYTKPGETRKRVYRYVQERLLEGRPPSLREIQAAFGFRSVESARMHMDALAAAGLIIKEPGISRGYRLPERDAGARPTVLVPLIGQVQAGDLTAAVEDPEGLIPVHSNLSSEDLFALRVRGESMTGAGILPGDIAIVRRDEDVVNGDVVVALVEDEATIKILRKQGHRVVLEPRNPNFQTILPDPRKLAILGKVVEVRRYLEGVPLLESH
jgi:repressor LexA